MDDLMTLNGHDIFIQCLYCRMNSLLLPRDGQQAFGAYTDSLYI